MFQNFVDLTVCRRMKAPEWNMGVLEVKPPCDSLLVVLRVSLIPQVDDLAYAGLLEKGKSSLARWRASNHMSIDDSQVFDSMSAGNSSV